MDYQDAKDIRKKSFGTLLGEQEGGLGTSLKKTVSLKTQAKMTGIKETFDPMNIAKKATFGSNWAPAMVGKMLSRDNKSMEYFTGAKFKKGSTSPIDDVESGSTSEPVKLLGLIYKELLRAQEYRKLKQEEENNQKKEKDKEENSRDEQLIEAVTGRKPKTRAQKKAERRKRRKEEKKEVPPTKEAPKPTTKEAPKAPTKEAPKPTTKEAPKAPTKEAPKPTTKEAPKAPEKVPTKEVPKEAPKAPEKVPAKEAPKAPEKVPTKEVPKIPKMTGGDKDVMEMIKVHEGVRTKPYKDSLGLWTIGVGHLIGDGKSLPPEWNRELSMQEVDELFAKDYAQHKQMAMKTPGWDKANETGQAAMIDLAFNMGGNWYKKWPSTAKALEAGDFDKAADGLKDSKWYQQVKGRAVKIVSMIREGSKENSASEALKKQELPATLNSTTGTQIDQASKKNKDLKEALNKDKVTNTVNNNTNVSVTSNQTKVKKDVEDDSNPYLQKTVI